MIFRTEHGRAEGMGAPYISRSIGAWPRIIHIAMQHDPSSASPFHTASDCSELTAFIAMVEYCFGWRCKDGR